MEHISIRGSSRGLLHHDLLRCRVLLTVSLGALLHALEQVVRCELLPLGCHHHRRLHRLLLVNVLDLVEHDTLHRSRWHTGGATQDKGVVLGIAGWFWRQIQHFCRLPMLRDLVVLQSEVASHEAELATLGAATFVNHRF